MALRVVRPQRTGELEPGPAEQGPGSVSDGHETRLAELDGLRALAVTLVWAYHAVLVAGPLRRLVVPFGLEWRAGVQVFFVLSGFLIYGPFARAHLTGAPAPRLVAYARRRALRIYPAYLLALGVLWALGWIVLTDGSNVAGHLTLTQGYRPDNPGTAGIEPAWTLCIEVSFYAFVPLWAAAMRRIGRWTRRPLAAEVGGAVLLIVWGLVAACWAYLGEIPFGLEVMSPHLAALAAGMLLSVLAGSRADQPSLDRWLRRIPPAVVWWTVAAAALLWMPGRPHAYDDPARQWLIAHLTHILFGVLVAVPVMLGSSGVMGRFLRLGPVTWIGVVSYGIYLWHYDLLFDLAPSLWSGGRIQAAAGVAAVAAVSVTVGAASHYLIERPALAFAHRRARTG